METFWESLQMLENVCKCFWDTLYGNILKMYESFGNLIETCGNVWKYFGNGNVWDTIFMLLNQRPHFSQSQSKQKPKQG